ncbi:ATP-binding protein [Actinospica sp. MGRD01-02]|uniref:ATP-binding protein n=1 Tax=Actinospica acidithermotolerans TaxID=2828514 RepID=A0A941IH89_9ACTN|nr:ATP-binding protein [Actinospica acidithermotolerans]MBR7824938.1 ATP-binding protein [Actinospica acidithermotolerans]
MSVLAIDGTTYGVNLGAYTDAPGLGRRFITQLCDLWGVEDDAAERALLLGSELVTNAVLATSRLLGRHWGRFIVVRASVTASELRVEVLDHSPDMPVVQQSDADSESGRGLILVSELADEWGCRPEPARYLAHDGKAVWFALKLRQPPRPRSAEPAHEPLDPDEVTPATPVTAVRPSPRPDLATQEPEMYVPLPRRAQCKPGARPQARPAIPSRLPAPSACVASLAAREQLEDSIRRIKVEVS